MVRKKESSLRSTDGQSATGISHRTRSRTKSEAKEENKNSLIQPNGRRKATEPNEERYQATVEHKSKFKSFRVRLYSTIVLISSFAAIIYAGHVPLMMMVLAIQTVMVKELFQLAREAQRERSLPGFRAQQWYFYFVAAFWVYLRFIKNNLMVEITSSAALARLLGWAIRRHTLISFSLYTAGFVAFVLTLNKGAYTYQFGQFAWTHMILLVVFIPSSFFVSNIFEGIIWFLLPCTLVIVNDIAAYLAGFFFGRTPLIKLSPKKTWEGFIGGFFGTLLASWFLAGWMSRFAWLTCPRTDLSIWQPMDCTSPPDTFQIRSFRATDIFESHLKEDGQEEPLQQIAHRMFDRLPHGLQLWAEAIEIKATPMQFHALALAIFASAIAPFGGFFASGFKRGFKIKDFGRSIPGHGGMTDRMDCQVVMATFSYIYYHAFTDRNIIPMGAVLTMALKLREVDQLELLLHLAYALESQGIISSSVAEAIAREIKPERLTA